MKLSTLRIILIHISLVALLPACQHPDPSSTMDEKEYQSYIQDWKESRLTYLKGPEGWLNLVGLHWLEKGSNTVGSDPSNAIVFPGSFPPRLGTFYLERDSVTFVARQGSGVTHLREEVVEILMIPDITGKPTTLEYGSHQWFIIKRGDRHGIRLRDLEHPAIRQLDSMPTYPPQLKWKVVASLAPLKTPYKLKMGNVLGQVETYSIKGTLTFSINGKPYEIYPMGEPPDLWFIFADETSAVETYGGGRFLQVEETGHEGTYILDFNKAYNPPCAFTPFATCPLPPKENILDIKVTAGEKSPGLDLH